MRILQPAGLADACELLARHEAVPLAGATDLFVRWPERPEEHGRTYLDLTRLDELRPMRWTEDELVLGALTTYWDVIREDRIRGELPLLVEAARQVGSIQIRARGTWAGNIANASPAADGVPVLMAYDAIVVLRSVDGEQELPLADFYTGYRETRRRPDQLITAIRIPRRTYELQRFVKVGPRRAQAITKVGVAVTRSAAGWRVIANSMAPTVRRCPAIERLLEGPPLQSPEEVLGAIRSDLSAIDDIRSTARYREQTLARVLFYLVGAESANGGR